MGKFIARLIVYFGIFEIMALLNAGVSGDVWGMALIALVLVLANMIVRPLLTVLALPFSLVTFGLAGIFVNMLTLLIADAIVACTAVAGFWWMALVSFVVMLADALIRCARHAKYSHV